MNLIIVKSSIYHWFLLVNSSIVFLEFNNLTLVVFFGTICLRLFLLVGQLAPFFASLMNRIGLLRRICVSPWLLWLWHSDSFLIVGGLSMSAMTLSGWWFGTWFLFFHSVGNVIIPTDELIFFRGVQTTNQVMIVFIWLSWFSTLGNSAPEWDASWESENEVLWLHDFFVFAKS